MVDDAGADFGRRAHLHKFANRLRQKPPISSSLSPISEGRATSFWLIATPPGSCARYSANPQSRISCSDLAEFSACSRRGPSAPSGAALPIGREPCKTVGRALLAVEGFGRNLAVFGDERRHGSLGRGEQSFGREYGFFAAREHVGNGNESME